MDKKYKFHPFHRVFPYFHIDNSNMLYRINSKPLQILPILTKRTKFRILSAEVQTYCVSSS